LSPSDQTIRVSCITVIIITTFSNGIISQLTIGYYPSTPVTISNQSINPSIIQRINHHHQLSIAVIGHCQPSSPLSTNKQTSSLLIFIDNDYCNQQQ